MTNWNLIRDLMNTAIDACEAVEKLEITLDEWDILTELSPATVWEVLQSAWTSPEAVQYSIIRARHQLGDDLPYRPAAARTLAAVAQVCSELIDAKDITTGLTGINPHHLNEEQSITDTVSQLALWYRKHMIPQLTKAINAKRAQTNTP